MRNRMTRCTFLTIFCLAFGCSQEQPAAKVVPNPAQPNGVDTTEMAGDRKPNTESAVQAVPDDATIEKALLANGMQLNKYESASGFIECEPNIVDPNGALKPEAIAALKKYIQPSWSMSFSIRQNAITDRTLEQLSTLPFITTVRLGDTDLITDNGLSHLSKLSRLTHLTLANEPKFPTAQPTSITDQGVSQLAKIATLEQLEIGIDAPAVKGHFVASFDNHAKLAVLTIIGGAGKEKTLTSDEGLSSAKGLNNLRAFYLGFSPVRGSGLTFLKNCPNLEIFEVRVECPEITDDAFASLAGLPKLKSVSANSEKISGNTLRSLSQCPALESCTLVDAKLLTDEDIANLTSLRNLTKLTLSGADKLTNAALDSIAKLTNLKELTLGKTQITDEGIEKLAPLKKLRVLAVDKTKVTAAGASKLKQTLPSLDQVYLGEGS